MSSLRTIVHPTDFSESSRYAFYLATNLARQQGARLIVLHVKQNVGPVVMYGKAQAHLEAEEYQGWLWKQLQRLTASESEIGVEHRLHEGDAAKEILRVAAETSCDLIIMGSHGRTGIERMLLGSVAERVQSKATCPVVTVKTPRWLGNTEPSSHGEDAACSGRCGKPCSSPRAETV